MVFSYKFFIFDILLIIIKMKQFALAAGLALFANAQ